MGIYSFACGVAKEQAAAMLAEHETESARQRMAAESRALKAEAVARETIVKHQVDSRTHMCRTYTHSCMRRVNACARPYLSKFS